MTSHGLNTENMDSDPISGGDFQIFFRKYDMAVIRPAHPVIANAKLFNSFLTFSGYMQLNKANMREKMT